MDPLPNDPATTPSSLDPAAPSLDPEAYPPTDIQGSKMDLDDIPARVAERAEDVLPQRMIGLSFLVLAVVVALLVVAGILLLMNGLDGY